MLETSASAELMTSPSPDEDEPPSVPSVAEDEVAVEVDHAARDERMAQLDSDDFVYDFVHELVSQSLECADAAYVERRLMGYTARAATNTLFSILVGCEPTLADHGAVVCDPFRPPAVGVHEDPPTCAIDATCHLEIRTRESRPMTPPSTPHKSKRLMIATALTASSMRSSSSSLTSSPRVAKAKTPTPATSPTGHAPGVPFSTVPTASPRKSVALLKTAVRLATAAPSRLGTVPVDETSSLDDPDRSMDGDSETMDDKGAPREPTRKPFVAPNTTTISAGAWSITLPGPLTMREEAMATTSVDVEFTVPQKLPVVGRRQSLGVESRRTSRDGPPRRATFFEVASEQDAVEIDALGMLGTEMRTQLALSPGVKLQNEDGELVKRGPLLPDVPTKMRRATFMEESLALAAASLATSMSPTRPPGRPSTTQGVALHRNDDTGDDINGVFSLTECSPLKCAQLPHHESTRSLAMSHAGSIASSTTTATSVKTNLFRKPSKVARPCTAASQCCRSHAEDECASAPPPSAESFVDIVKQRAFQRKPSFLNTSPPKKTPSRRSLLSPKSAASPLSRRSLLSTKNQDDPLHNATPLL